MDTSRPKSNLIVQEILSAFAKEMGCGAKGDRTLDLHVANVALYQLSYRPEKKARNISAPPACRQAFNP